MEKDTRSQRQPELAVLSGLSRRELLVKGTGVTAAAAAAYALRGPAGTLLPGAARASTTAPATTAWNHDPGSPLGPLHWGELDPVIRRVRDRHAAIAGQPRDRACRHRPRRAAGAQIRGVRARRREHRSRGRGDHPGRRRATCCRSAGTATSSRSITSTPPRSTPSTGGTRPWRGTSSTPMPRVTRPSSACSTASGPAQPTAREDPPDGSGGLGRRGAAARRGQSGRPVQRRRRRTDQAWPGPRRLVLRLCRLAHHARLHREHALVGAFGRRTCLARGRGALPQRDRQVRRLRRIPEQQPPRCSPSTDESSTCAAARWATTIERLLDNDLTRPARHVDASA